MDNHIYWMQTYTYYIKYEGVWKQGAEESIRTWEREEVTWSPRNLRNEEFHQINYLGSHLKEDEMGGTFSTHKSMKSSYKILNGKPWGWT